MADKVFRLVLALGISIVIARTLGPEQFGILQYAVSFAGLFGMMISLGIEPIIVRDLVQYPERAGQILGTTMVMRAVVATGAFLLLMAVGAASQSREVYLLIAIIGLGFLFQPFLVIEQYFLSQTKASRSSIVFMLAALSGAIWAGFCILSDASLPFFALQSVIESLVIASGLYLVFHLYAESRIKLAFDRKLMKSIMVECWPVAASLAMIGLYSNIDKIMIKEILGGAETGVYVAAVRLSEAWYFVPMVIVNSLLPAIVRARNVSEHHYRRRMQNLYDLLVWLAIIIALPVSLLADSIIRALYGELYVESAPILAIHVWYGGVVFLSVASGRWLILEGLARIYLLRTAIGVVVNIILNSALIPYLGILGAVVSAGLSQLIVLLFPSLFLRRHREDAYRIFNSLLIHRSLRRLSGGCP